MSSFQLQLSYSTNPEDQQRAAIDMAHLVEGSSVFPAVSFGPISHALCKLVPSTNRTVASYSARAMKLLLLDDALRPQVSKSGNSIISNSYELLIYYYGFLVAYVKY